MRECGIVRDLLPLYQEGMLSPDSVEFLEEHLKTCPACRAEREKLAAEPLPPEEKTETAPELESVRALLDDDIQRIEIATYTEGGAGRFVFTDSAAIAEIHALCCALSLGAETNIGVADDGLTLAFVTAEGETALRFEGRYAVVGEKRYETEQLGALKKDLRERIQSEIFASE